MVSEADSAVLYLCAQTDYEDQFPHYRSGIDPVPQALQRVQVAAEKGYEALYQAHLADYQALFDRVEIQVGQEEETSLPTDKLLKKYKKGAAEQVVGDALFSIWALSLDRLFPCGDLPANLQGVWNAKNNPAWQSDYHLNVNLQIIIGQLTPRILSETTFAPLALSPGHA